MYLVVEMVVLVLCVMGVTSFAAIQHNGMGVPALPSVVFRLRFAPVPPKSQRDFPPAPLTLAGQCRYRLCTRAPRGMVLRCRSAGHSQQVVTGLKSTFLKAPRKSRRRHVQCRSGGHSAALRDRLQVDYRGTQRIKQGAGQRHMMIAGPDTSLRYMTGPEST